MDRRSQGSIINGSKIKANYTQESIIRESLKNGSKIKGICGHQGINNTRIEDQINE